MSAAQQPAISSFSPDGALTWTNAAGTDVAFVELLSPAASSQWVTAHAELPTGTVSQAQLALPGGYGWFRVSGAEAAATPTNMVLVPAGAFLMGDALNDVGGVEWPVHVVAVSAFLAGRHEVTNDEMIDVMQWAYDTGRVIAGPGGATNAFGIRQELLDLDAGGSRITWDGSAFQFKEPKASGYPCVEVTWYGAAAYCNFLSEREGRTPAYDLNDWSCDWTSDGYRLPTEAEWEKAARGGALGRRFAWADSDTIQHARANYNSSSSYSYDTSPTRGFHPDYDDGGFPYTNPIGALPPNGYGLHDVIGNVFEWCADWYGSGYYAVSPDSDPHGPASGDRRVVRGGSWLNPAPQARAAARVSNFPVDSVSSLGFRVILPAGP